MRSIGETFLNFDLSNIHEIWYSFSIFQHICSRSSISRQRIDFQYSPKETKLFRTKGTLWKCRWFVLIRIFFYQTSASADEIVQGGEKWFRGRFHSRIPVFQSSEAVTLWAPREQEQLMRKSEISCDLAKIRSTSALRCERTSAFLKIPKIVEPTSACCAATPPSSKNVIYFLQ